MPIRTIVALVLATAALLLLAPAADAAPAVTARIGSVEYAATSTQGRFGGATDGQVRGAWQATVVHDPLGSDVRVHARPRRAAPTTPPADEERDEHRPTARPAQWITPAAREPGTTVTAGRTFRPALAR